jgi:hypothetical protein
VGLGSLVLADLSASFAESPPTWLRRFAQAEADFAGLRRQLERGLIRLTPRDPTKTAQLKSMSSAGIHPRTLYPSAKSTIRAIAISSIGVACASARSCAPLTYRTVLNNTPTTVPTMYMAQAERLRWVFVEVNIKYSPRSAIPKLLAVANFAT